MVYFLSLPHSPLHVLISLIAISFHHMSHLLGGPLTLADPRSQSNWYPALGPFQDSSPVSGTSSPAWNRQILPHRSSLSSCHSAANTANPQTGWQKQWFTGTNGQRINTLIYQTVNSFCFCFFVCLSFVLVLFSHLSHQTGPTVILPFSLEPGTTTPAGVNLWNRRVAHRTLKQSWKPFWPSWVRPGGEGDASSPQRGKEVALWRASRPPRNNPRNISKPPDPYLADFLHICSIPETL